MKAAVIVFAVAMLSVTSPSLAQRPGAVRPRAGRLGAGAAQPENRAQMERRIRETFFRVAKQRVGLDDNQMRKLTDVNGRYEPQRRELLREENQTRRALREEMMNNAKPDDAKVSAGLAKLQEIRRRRLEIDDQEQRDIANFMTPTQQARYHALQEQLRRRIEQMRQEHRENRLTDDSVPETPVP
jgi:Spy/CpxP family protein refolding chaperone